MTITSPSAARTARAKPARCASKGKPMWSPTATSCISDLRPEISRAVALHAREQVYLPLQIIAHSLRRVAAALVRLEPHVDRFVGHPQRLGSERITSFLPGVIAAGEITNRSI